MFFFQQIPFGQRWIIDRMIALGYKNSNVSGVCFGISHMAMQAILADEFDQFYSRLQLISTIPLNGFQKRINDIKKTRMELIAKIKDKVEKENVGVFDNLSKTELETLESDLVIQAELTALKKMVSELNLDDESTARDFENRKQDWLRKAFLQKKIQNEIDKELLSLTDDERISFDIPAFLEGIEIYQKSYKYPDLFAEKKPFRQDARFSMPLVLSKDLEQQGGIVEASSFTGAYDDTSLAAYFDILQEAVETTIPYLERQLELATKILQLRRGKLFPKNAGAEQISSEEAAWTYALFSAGLLDSLFYLLVNREVKMTDGKKQTMGIWNPLTGSLYKQAKFYEVRLVTHQPEHLDVVMAALAEHIIPVSAIQWLTKVPHLFKQWWNVILQVDTADNEIHQLIEQAKENHRSQEKPTSASLFLDWTGNHAAHFPDGIFRVKDGLFINKQMMEKFLHEHPSCSKPSLLAELQNGNLLQVAHDDFYHRYAPKNFADRNVITGILLNLDGLPQFASMSLNRTYNKEICS